MRKWWRGIQFLAQVLIGLGAALTVAWYALRYYFADVNHVDERVRMAVSNQATQSHSPVLNYDDIPTVYRNAVVAVEDRRFFSNVGIDFRGMGRALVVDIRGTQTLQGGSTITQQLVHNTLLANMPKSLMWKLMESIYAVGLYDTMSKQETLALYADDIYFGHGAYGLYDAAIKYFGRPPSELNEGELTMLAGLPNAPSVYDPFVHMDLALRRQEVVVQSMVMDGFITQTEANQILHERIRLATGTSDSTR